MTEKMEYIIHLKGGGKIDVSKFIADTLKSRLLEEGGCGKFQFFSDKEDDTFFVINIEHIQWIEKVKKNEPEVNAITFRWCDWIGRNR